MYTFFSPHLKFTKVGRMRDIERHIQPYSFLYDDVDTGHGEQRLCEMIYENDAREKRKPFCNDYSCALCASLFAKQKSILIYV